MSASLRLTSRRLVLPKLRTFSRSVSVFFTRSRTVAILADSRQLLARTDRSSSWMRHVQLLLKLRIDHRLVGVAKRGDRVVVGDVAAQLEVLHERVEVLAENLAGFDQRHLRRERAVGPDLQDQAVVVGLLADAGIFGRVANARHRRVDAVDRDQADFLLFVVADVLRGGHVAAALVDRQRHFETDIFGQRRDDQVLVDDRDRRVGFDHAGGDRRRPCWRRASFPWLVGVELHDQALDVEDDVGDIFHHARQAGEFVLGAFEADVGDGRAFEAD